MKFKFKIQQYRTDAVDAVVRVFNGQTHNDARIQCGNFACGAFRHGGTSMCGNDLPLDLLAETDYLKAEEYRSLYVDCEELRKMLSSTLKIPNFTRTTRRIV